MDEEVIKNKFYKLRLHSDAGETQNDKEKKTTRGNISAPRLIVSSLCIWQYFT